MPVQTQDIRRDVAQSQPTNYIAPGVENTAAAQAVTGLFKVGMEYDAGKRQADLGDEVNQITSDYLTHSPVSQEIKPLDDSLASVQAAHDQGKITFNQFQTRVDRAVREAISRRPGLAQEFRAIGAQYAGGPAVEYLMNAERAADAAKQTSADKAETRQYEEDQRVLKEMRERGLDGPLAGNAHPTSGEIQAQYALVGGVSQAMTQNSVAYKALTEKKQGAQDQAYFSEPERIADFSVMTDEIHSKAITGISEVSQKLLDPTLDGAGLAAASLEASNMASSIVNQIKDYGAVHQIPQEVIDSRVAQYNNFRDVMKEFPKLDLQQRTQQLEVLKVSSILSYRNSSPAANAMAVINDALGPQAVPMLISMQPKGGTAAVLAQAFQDGITGQTTDPVGGSIMASAALQSYVALAVPSKVGGEALSPQAQKKTGEAIPAIIRPLYLIRDKDFAKNDIIHQWGTRGPGFIDQLAQNASNLAKNMGAMDKVETAKETARAANNVVRVAWQGLVNSTPSLDGMLMVDWSNGTQVLKYNGNRVGGDLTTEEKLKIQQYNTLINVPSVNKAIDIFTDAGGDADKTSKFLAAYWKNAGDRNAAAANIQNKPQPAAVPKNAPETTSVPEQFASSADGTIFDLPDGSAWKKVGNKMQKVK